jgi:hypothetical protein
MKEKKTNSEVVLDEFLMEILRPSTLLESRTGGQAKDKKRTTKGF